MSGDDSLLRRGPDVWEPRTQRWVAATEQNMASIRRVIQARDSAARERGQFYNQVSGRSETASLENLQGYGNGIAQLRIQNAMQEINDPDDRAAAVHSLRVLQQAERNGTLFGLIGLERVGQDTVIVHSPNFNTVRAAFALFKGQTVRFQYGYDQDNADQDIVRDERVQVGSNFSHWWHQWSMSIVGHLLESSNFAIWHGNDWPVKITVLHNVSNLGQVLGVGEGPADGGDGEAGDDDEVGSQNTDAGQPRVGEKFVRDGKVYEFDGENFMHVGDVPDDASSAPTGPVTRARARAGGGLSGMARDAPLPGHLVDRILGGYRNHAGQRFLDDKFTHCVLGPIVEFFEQSYLDSVDRNSAAETLAMWLNAYQKADALLKKYKGVGLSEDELLAVAKELKIHIVVHLPLQPGGPNAHTFDTHGRVDIARVNKVFHFVNLRLNHLEVSSQRCVTTRAVTKNVVWLTPQEMHDKKIVLDARDEFYMFRAAQGRLKTIVTLHATYRTDREIEEALGQFYDDPNLLRPVRGAPLAYQFKTLRALLPEGYYELDDRDKRDAMAHASSRCMRFTYIFFDILKEPWKARFLELATHWPTWAKADLTSLPKQYLTDRVAEVDVRKCYAQHRCARNYGCYRGFLGKITDMAPCTYEDFKEHWVGAYRVTKFDWSGASTELKRVHEKWPLFIDGHCYATPMILFFINNGGKVEIDYGLWGMAFDFEYPEYMYQKQPKIDAEGNEVGKGAALYSLLAGYCASGNNDVNYSFKCDPEFLGILMKHQDMAGEDVRVNYDQHDGIAHVSHKTRHKRAAPQFSLYVTTYAVLHVYAALLKLPVDDVLAVKSDAILLSTRFYWKTDQGPLPPLPVGYDQDTGCGDFKGGDPKELVRVRFVSLEDVKAIRCSPGATVASGIFDPNTNPRSSKWLGDNEVYQQARNALISAQQMVAGGAGGVYEDDVDIGDIRPGDLEECILQTNCIGDALDLLLTTRGLSKQDMFAIAGGSVAQDFLEMREEQQRVMEMVSRAPCSKMPPNRNIVGDDGEASPNKLFNNQLIVCLGPGGCGKTTSIFGDPRFGSVAMMVVPHCQRDMFRKRNDDPDDNFVTQLYGPAATEVVACTGKSFELWVRYRNWLSNASVFVIDEGSMIQPEKLSEMISQLRGIGKVVVCMDRYQTPPIQLCAGADQPELTDEDFKELGATVHEFWYSYRQEPDDPIRGLIHDLRKDMKEELFDKYVDPTHPLYERAATSLAARWCDKLMGIRGISMDEVFARIRLGDSVMSYTNHNGRVFDMLVNNRCKFYDDNDVRMFRWVVHTNAYKMLGLFNGSVVYQTRSPIAQTDAQIRQHPEDIQPFVLCTKKSARRVARRRREREEGDDDGDVEMDDDEVPRTMKRMQGHGRTRLPCDVRWCDTIHGMQGATVSVGRQGFIDVDRMKDPRVLQTAISRFQRLDQIYFFRNTEASMIADDPNSFRGHVYLLRYKADCSPSTRLLPPHMYVGRTTSMNKVLENANVRMQQHIRSCRAFVRENRERAALNGHAFRMPAPKTHGWCNSFHVIYPVLDSLDDLEAVILETLYFTKQDESARYVLEHAEHKWIEYYQGQGSTNVHGVELN